MENSSAPLHLLWSQFGLNLDQTRQFSKAKTDEKLIFIIIKTKMEQCSLLTV